MSPERSHSPTRLQRAAFEVTGTLLAIWPLVPIYAGVGDATIGQGAALKDKAISDASEIHPPVSAEALAEANAHPSVPHSQEVILLNNLHREEVARQMGLNGGEARERRNLRLARRGIEGGLAQSVAAMLLLDAAKLRKKLRTR